MRQFFDAGGRWRFLNDDSGYSVIFSRHHPYFSDHHVQDLKVLPGVVYIELALMAAARRFPMLAPKIVEDIVWLRPIICSGDNADIRVRLNPINDNRVEYFIEYGGDICGYGSVCGDDQRSSADTLATPLNVRDQVVSQTQDHFTRAELYRSFADMGIVYGEYFQRINYVQRHDNLALSWLSNSDGIFMGWSGLMDCSFQSGMAISIGEHSNSLMPYSLGRLVFHRSLPAKAMESAFVLTEKCSSFRTNITIFDQDYNPLLSVFDLGVKPSNFNKGV